MPPKVRRRPAAVVGRDRRSGVLRRPAHHGDEAAPDSRAEWESGREVPAHPVPADLLASEVKIVVTKGTYWEEETKAVGLVKGLQVAGGTTTLQMEVLGTTGEGLVKWKGSNPNKFLDIHLCPADCGRLVRDGLIHAEKLQLWKEGADEGWMSNLVDTRGPAEKEEDQLRIFRERSRHLGGGPPPEGAPPGAEEIQGSSASSESKKKKDRKKKKKKKKAKLKVSGTKPLDSVFGNTCLDPKPEVRKTLKRRARKLARRKGAKASASSSSSSVDSSETTGEAQVGRLFGEEVRVKRVAAAYPGALTLNTVEFMQSIIVQQTGQPWNMETAAIPPVFLQYWRLALAPNMSGPMLRETQTLAYLQDLLLQGKIACATDVVTQRLKSLQQNAQGAHYTIAQRQEIVPVDYASMSSPVETLEASRLHREEQKAKAAAAKPWERRGEWESRRVDDVKGKGKAKDAGKAKGKAKGDQGEKNKEDSRKGK